jgi:hypothetical protein
MYVLKSLGTDFGRADDHLNDVAAAEIEAIGIFPCRFVRQLIGDNTVEQSWDRKVESGRFGSCLSALGKPPLDHILGSLSYLCRDSNGKRPSQYSDHVGLPIQVC